MVLVGVFVYVIIERDLIYQQIEVFIKWLAENPVEGPWILTLVVCLGEIFFLPGSLLCIGAGFAFKRAYVKF